MNLRQYCFAHGLTRSGHATARAAAVAACLLVSACGSAAEQHSKASSDTAPATAAVSASPTLAAADAAKMQVLAAYQGFWKIQEEAYANGSLDGLPINTFAVGQAASGIRSSLYYYTTNHLVIRGKPTLSPQVTAIDLTSSPHTANLTDCVDTSSFMPVDATTGQPAKLDSAVHRHLWTFTATFDNVRWYINTGTINRSGSC